MSTAMSLEWNMNSSDSCKNVYIQYKEWNFSKILLEMLMAFSQKEGNPKKCHLTVCENRF